MKLTFSIFLFFLLFITINAQTQTGIIHGKILDQNKNPLPGASVSIVGTKYGINSNEAGEYLFDHILTGKIELQASFIGFKTTVTELDVQPGHELSGPDTRG